MRRSFRVSFRLQSGRSSAASSPVALLFLLVAAASGFAPVERGAAGRGAGSTATELRSIPGPLDTLTSGLASIVRIEVRREHEAEGWQRSIW